MATMAFAALRRSLASKLTIGIGGLLALGLTTAQTLRDAMPPASLPAARVGQSIEAGRWQVVIREAGLSKAPRPDGEKKWY